MGIKFIQISIDNHHPRRSTKVPTAKLLGGPGTSLAGSFAGPNLQAGVIRPAHQSLVAGRGRDARQHQHGITWGDSADWTIGRGWEAPMKRGVKVALFLFK